MLNFRTAILAFLVASASAIPTPQASETPESTTSVEVASFEQTVDCGCWNMCTLQQLATPSIICSQECDPQFACAPDSDSDSAGTSVEKRTLPRNPFAPTMTMTSDLHAPKPQMPSMGDNEVTKREVPSDEMEKRCVCVHEPCPCALDNLPFGKNWKLMNGNGEDNEKRSDANRLDARTSILEYLGIKSIYVKTEVKVETTQK